MTADVLNLRRARKAKARAAAAASAAEARQAHGRPKAARDLDAACRAIDDRRLDGHRRDGDA